MRVQPGIGSDPFRLPKVRIQFLSLCFQSTQCIIWGCRMNQKLNVERVNSKLPLAPADLQKVLHLIKTTKHGSVTVIIQDGQAIQIDRNEKLRLK